MKKAGSKKIESFINSGRELLEQGDNDGAINAFTAALLHDADWQIYVDRSIAYKNKKEYDNAIADLKKRSQFWMMILFYLHIAFIFIPGKKR